MGLLVNGQWQDKWYDTDSSNGKFERETAQLRHWVTVDGSAGITGEAGFKAQANRYHLYVSLACPWAHRTLIFRALKGLQDLTTYIKCIQKIILSIPGELQYPYCGIKS